MNSSKRYWGTLLVAAVLTAGLSIFMLVTDRIPSIVGVALIVIASFMFLWSSYSLIRKSPPR